MKLPTLRALSIAFALLAQSPVAAHEIVSGDIEIIHPHIPLPLKGAQSVAAYMTIANNGTTPDTLIGIETSIADSATLHKSEVGADGIARMRPLGLLPLLPEDSVLFEQGGMHVMLMGLHAPIAEGDMIPATLIFQNAGRVDISFMVDPDFGNSAAMDHSTMHHGN